MNEGFIPFGEIENERIKTAKKRQMLMFNLAYTHTTTTTPQNFTFSIFLTADFVVSPFAINGINSMKNAVD